MRVDKSTAVKLLRFSDGFFIFSILHKLQEIRRLPDFCNRVPGRNLQPLHQHPVLFFRQFECFFCRTRPSEGTIIQAFVQQQETVTFPQQRFDPVAPPAAEKKQRIFIIRIQGKLEAHNLF